MKFTLKREEEFVPKWNGNQEADEPIRFLCKHLSIVDREDLIKVSFGEDGKPLTKLDFLRAFKSGVKHIDNLIVDGKAIETVVDYLSLPGPGFSTLMQEVGSHIISMTAAKSEEDSKNSA